MWFLWDLTTSGNRAGQKPRQQVTSPVLVPSTMDQVILHQLLIFKKCPTCLSIAWCFRIIFAVGVISLRWFYLDIKISHPTPRHTLSQIGLMRTYIKFVASFWATYIFDKYREIPKPLWYTRVQNTFLQFPDILWWNFICSEKQFWLVSGDGGASPLLVKCIHTYQRVLAQNNGVCFIKK